MAVDTGDRVRHLFAGLLIRHLVQCVKALNDVALAELLIGLVSRGVAVDAGSGLLGDGLPLGKCLVLEHIGMASFLAEIDREGIAIPHGLQPRVFFEP